MSDTDNYLKILEKMGEISSAVGILNNEIAHLKQDMSETRTEVRQIKEEDIQQNQLLAEHILGVNTNRERLNLEIETRKNEKELLSKQILDLDIRLKNAEFVPNLVSNLKTAILWIGGLAGAAVAIAKFMHLF
jgi:chromosome segregation ATPase